MFFYTHYLYVPDSASEGTAEQLAFIFSEESLLYIQRPLVYLEINLIPMLISSNSQYKPKESYMLLNSSYNSVKSVYDSSEQQGTLGL